jgi:integrase/recombinase XerD
MKTYLEPEDIYKMEQAAICLRDSLLIVLLFHLGCRISEVLALSIEDIDLKNGLVTILHLKARIKILCPDCESRLSRTNSYCPKCGSKIDKAKLQEQEHKKLRTLPLDREIIALLGDYIKRGGPVIKNGKRYLFGINRHRAWQIVKECAEKAGLPDLINPETGKRHYVSPHRLRDAFAGDSLRLLQVHLGHASFDTTARYRKVAGEEHRRWYEKLWEKEADNG